MIGTDMTARVSSPVFIGRGAELDTLRDALDRARSGSPTTTLVGGEAGIGKSRLVGELGAIARESGALVLEGDCISLGSDEGLPFAPIAEALRGLVRRVDRAWLQELIDPATSELTRLVPELAAGLEREDGPAAPPEWAQTRLFQGFLTILARLGERDGLVLVLEDLHWADRSTRDLVAFVTRSMSTERVLIVVTYRTDELHRRHPLRPWLAEMERLSRVDRVELERFGRDELLAQLTAIEGRAPDPGLLDLIARRSEGNPFFAEELIGAWNLRDSTHVPDKLRDVLLSRLGSISDRARRVVGTAAVAAGTVDHDVLAAVSGMAQEDLVAALDEAVSSQILVPIEIDGRPAYAFRHALLGEAVSDGLLATERRRISAAYVWALEERDVPDGAAGASHLAALAHHATAAHDLPKALPAWIAAARASFRASAFPEAARAYERAAELWEAVPEADRPGDEHFPELLYEASDALLTADEPIRASDLARLAVEQVDPDREPLRSARLEERLAWAVYVAGDLAQGTRLLEETELRLRGSGPSPEYARTLASLATFIQYGGDYRRAITTAEQAVRACREAALPSHEIEALAILGSSLAIVGDCDRGLAVLREALDRATDLNNGSSLGMTYLALTSTLMDCNDLEEAAAVGLAATAWARDMRYGGFGGMAAEAFVSLGRWTEAQAIYDEAARSAEEGLPRLWNRIFEGIMDVRRGRLDEAQQLHTVERESANLLGDAAFAGNLGGALLELAISEGRLSAARSKADEALAWLGGSEDVRYRSRILQLAVRVESETVTAARDDRDTSAEELARRLGLSRLEMLRNLMAEFATTDSRAFTEARGNLALAEAEASRMLDRPEPGAWAAAATIFDDSRRPYELAWSRYRQGEAILAAKGPRGEAEAALGEAWLICRDLGAVPLRESIEGLARAARLQLPAVPAVDAEPGELVQADDGRTSAVLDPFGLTSREREVLALLAEGYTNRRIADALFISESTAGVHVSNILGKLGVSNRVEAAAIALRLSARKEVASAR
jgi:DNA-binding CsgD family transcriptional regulator/tetratricopeptide (TPR) repeat protein